MGKCGTHLAWETAGSNPLKELEEENKKKNEKMKELFQTSEFSFETEPEKLQPGPNNPSKRKSAISRCKEESCLKCFFFRLFQENQECLQAKTQKEAAPKTQKETE